MCPPDVHAEKRPPQILFYTISLFLWWAVLVSYAFHHSPLSLFFSNIHISAVLCLLFSPPDFQLFHDSFDVGWIFTSSTSQKSSASSLAVGPLWVSGSDLTGFIYSASLLPGYSDFVPGLIN